jgi:hypothetical protein
VNSRCRPHALARRGIGNLVGIGAGRCVGIFYIKVWSFSVNPVHDHICGWFLIGRGKACKWKHRYTPHAQANSVNRLFSSRLANVRALCRFFWTASRSHTRAPRQGFAWVGTCQQQWLRLDLGARRARLWSHSFRTDDEVRGKKPAKETLLFPPPAPNVRALFALPAVVL